MTPRPRKWRCCSPFRGDTFYKPRGVPMAELEVNSLALDEIEAMRLCDFEEKEQAAAAKAMKVSRQTVQRLLYAGRKKIMDALINAKAIAILKARR